MTHILISATRKSSGKTLFSIGLCRALLRCGLRIQPFKKGPDYIDPMWLSAASRQDCINLDFNTMTAQALINIFGCYAKRSDIALIEGNKGLFDGLDLHGSDCNAALAILLKAPVIIVIDAEGMTRGIAPLISGYQAFDARVEIAGVVLNNLGGSRHASKCRNMLEHYTDLTVLGAIQRQASMRIPERHLGLTTDKEIANVEQRIDTIAGVVEDQVDIDQVVRLAKTASLPLFASAPVPRKPGSAVCIGIARDAAFCFYYPDDLETFVRCGVKLVFFDTLRDAEVPPVDALVIGGGFPETHGDALEGNTSMKSSIRRFVRSGKPVYAECGGLMYLSREIQWAAKRNKMVGAIPADTRVHPRPVGRGYVELEYTTDHPWTQDANGKPLQRPVTVKAHEFHYASLHRLDKSIRFGYRVKRGQGIDGQHDGLIFGTVFASFAHMRNSESNPWIHRFVAAVATQKTQNTGSCDWIAAESS